MWVDFLTKIVQYQTNSGCTYTFTHRCHEGSVRPMILMLRPPFTQSANEPNNTIKLRISGLVIS